MSFPLFKLYIIIDLILLNPIKFNIVTIFLG